MPDQSKPNLLPTRATNLTVISDTRKSIYFVYGFMLTFILCTFFILFNPSSSPPWYFKTIVNFKDFSFPSTNGSHFSSFFSHFFPNSSSSVTLSNSQLPIYQNSSVELGNYNVSLSNDTNDGRNDEGFVNLGNSSSVERGPENNSFISTTHNSDKTVMNYAMKNSSSQSISPSIEGNKTMEKREKEGNELYEWMLHCNLFDGKWVKDDSYPLYAPGSCPHIDEPFNCFLNGRPDNTYERYRWQPHGCNIPRLNGTHMLELLRGKRLVFVGDSLNRNMWESLVCILRNSVKNKSRVFEVSGREEFRSEGSYSFILEDYNSSVEFFRSPFLVRQWEMLDENGLKKETLRLDLVESSSDRYKDADFLIFNTGHWWSHEKTSRGEGYYQEGSHVYSQLEVNEALRRALTTWGRWLDANVDPKKTQVFFRGYSNSHFGGGKWNTGGKCDKETEPIKNDTDLPEQPPMIKVPEKVLKWTKIPIFYLNITTLTDYRKDAHPAAYRAQYLTEEERLSPSRYQDCSHWCLPGVPDTWNELVYSQILIRNYQKLQEQQQQEQHHKRTGTCVYRKRIRWTETGTGSC